MYVSLFGQTMYCWLLTEKWPFMWTCLLTFKTKISSLYALLILHTYLHIFLDKDRIIELFSVTLTTQQSTSMTLVLPLINPPLWAHMFNTLSLIWEVPRQRFKTLWPQPFNLWPQPLAGSMSQSGDSVYLSWPMAFKRFIIIKLWIHILL